MRFQSVHGRQIIDYDAKGLMRWSVRVLTDSGRRGNNACGNEAVEDVPWWHIATFLKRNSNPNLANHIQPYSAFQKATQRGKIMPAIEQTVGVARGCSFKSPRHRQAFAMIFTPESEITCCNINAIRCHAQKLRPRVMTPQTRSPSTRSATLCASCEQHARLSGEYRSPNRKRNK